MSITEGIIGGVASHHVIKTLENKPGTPTELDYLAEIALAIKDLNIYIRNTAEVVQEEREFVQIPKAGLGIYFRPTKDRDGHSYKWVKIKSPVAVTLNVVASSFGTYNIVLTAGTWTILDDPVNSDYICDASFTSNFVTVWVKYTDSDL